MFFGASYAPRSPNVEQHVFSYEIMFFYHTLWMMEQRKLELRKRLADKWRRDKTWVFGQPYAKQGDEQDKNGNRNYRLCFHRQFLFRSAWRGDGFC